MAERLLAPKDVAKILGVGYEKAVLLMRSMRRINISTNPASCRPRYVVTESELTRWQKEKAKAPEIPPMPVSMKNEILMEPSSARDFAGHRKERQRDVPHRVSAAHGAEPLAAQAAHPAHGREGHTAKL